MCVIAVVGVAPCQCFSPGGNQTTSPGRISSIGPPSRCAQPHAGRDDQRLAERMGVPRRARARLERDARPGRPGPARATGTSGSMRTVPVNQSAEPFVDAFEPISLNFHFQIFVLSRRWLECGPTAGTAIAAAPRPLRNLRRWSMSVGEVVTGTQREIFFCSDAGHRLPTVSIFETPASGSRESIPGSARIASGVKQGSVSRLKPFTHRSLAHPSTDPLSRSCGACRDPAGKPAGRSRRDTGSWRAIFSAPARRLDSLTARRAGGSLD